MLKFFTANPVVHLSGAVWKYANGYRPWVVLYVCMSLLAEGVSLCAPLVIAELITSAQRLGGNELLYRAAFLLGIFFLIGVAFWALHGPARVIETGIAFHVKRAFQTTLFGKITSLPLKWHKDHHSGETIDQSAKATVALAEFTEGGFEILQLAVRFVGSVAILTWFMWQAGLVIIGFTLTVLTVVVLFDKALVKQYERLNKRYNEIAAGVQDYLTNIGTIISLRLETRVTQEIFDRSAGILPLQRENSITNELKWFTTSRLVDAAQVVIIFGFILLAVRSDSLVQVGALYALTEYLRSIGNSFFQFTYKYGWLVVRSTQVRAVTHIEDAFDREVRPTQTAHLPNSWRKLEVRNLSFTHPDTSGQEVRNGVHGVHLVLERGRSYAFVGESGCGKSTTLGLLRGLHRADSVEVVCDGCTLPHGLAHIAHHATLIPQDPEIFASSIGENITMGISADPSLIARSIGMARFQSVLSRLPRGLETGIAEKGVNLSGGEKQRLALARGLFFVEESGSEIVLLDESTSSVDIVNEKMIYEALLKEYSGRVVVSAIHKFNLLYLFDEIVVFVGGKVVEKGGLAKLLSADGELARLWRSYEGEGERENVL